MLRRLLNDAVSDTTQVDSNSEDDKIIINNLPTFPAIALTLFSIDHH